MLAVYVTLIWVQGDAEFSVVPWAALMAIPSAGAFVAISIEHSPTARRILIGSAIVFFVLGMVSVFTIGLGFLAAAVLSAVAARRL